MLSGEADVDLLAAAAPVLASLDPDPVALADVTVLQAAFELPAAARTAALPPGLHPTVPALAVVLAWRVGDSPWGPFSLAQVRVSCRSGVRPRGFVVGCVVDRAAAATQVASRWGLPAVGGEVTLRRRYDAVELVVACDGSVVCELTAVDPEPLSPADVAYPVTLTLARTERGPRLIQLEPDYELTAVERLRPRLLRFDGAAWGSAALRPADPVAATVGTGSVSFPRLRFVCRPDVMAFAGTETV